MATQPRLIVWLMFTVWEIKVRSEISGTGCGQLRFVGLPDDGTEHVITVEDGGDLSVIFFLNTDGCQELGNRSLITVTRNDNTSSDRVCRILMDGNTCDISDSSQCTCYNQTFAQYRKRATLSDEGSYVWSLYDKVLQRHQKRNFTFRILPAEGKGPLVVLLPVLLFCALAVCAALGCWIVNRWKQRTVVELCSSHARGQGRRDNEASIGRRQEETGLRGQVRVKEEQEDVSGYVDIDADLHVTHCDVIDISRDGSSDKHLNDRDQVTTAFEQCAYRSVLPRGARRDLSNSYENVNILPTSWSSRDRGGGAELHCTYLHPV